MSSTNSVLIIWILQHLDVKIFTRPMLRNKLKWLWLSASAINLPGFLLVYEMCPTFPFLGPSCISSLPGMCFSFVLSVTGSLPSISFQFLSIFSWREHLQGTYLGFSTSCMQQNTSFSAPCIVELLTHVLAYVFIGCLPDCMVSS